MVALFLITVLEQNTYKIAKEVLRKLLGNNIPMKEFSHNIITKLSTSRIHQPNFLSQTIM